MLRNVCYVLNNRDYEQRLYPKSDEGIFLGYSTTSRAYGVFNKVTNFVMKSVNFTIKALDDEEVVELVDKTFGMVRTEVRSEDANSHLGHVFNDGPKESGGLRYCINSAAVQFIPFEKLEELGYEDLISHFEK